jgi:hypothetical protein
MAERQFDTFLPDSVKLEVAVGTNYAVRVAEPGRLEGSSFSSDAPGTREEHAVLKEWSPTPAEMGRMAIEDGALVLTGIAAPQTSTKTGESLPGGGQQNVVLDPRQMRLVGSPFSTPAELR